MSVILDGEIIKEGEAVSWTGLWQFAKEKKVGLDFLFTVN
jgi:hypothetical protein